MTSCGGGRYFLVMATAYKRYVKVYIVETRYNIKGYFNSYVQWIEGHTYKKVGRIHTYNAPDFLQMRCALDRTGITLTTSSAYTHQANDLAEGMEGTVLDKALFTIDHSVLKLTFCAETIWHSADLHNRTVTVEIGSKNLMTALLGTTLDSSKLGIFGGTAFVPIQKANVGTNSTVGPTKAFT